MDFFAISFFKNALDSLCKKERWLYTSCKKDICEALKDLSFADIIQKGDKLREEGDVKVLKIRMKNSLQNLSSKDGFRLILLCNRKYNSVTLLNIYPKRGKMAKENQSPLETTMQLKIYIEEFNNQLLIKLDINDHLKVISDNAIID